MLLSLSLSLSWIFVITSYRLFFSRNLMKISLYSGRGNLMDADSAADPETGSEYETETGSEPRTARNGKGAEGEDGSENETGSEYETDTAESTPRTPTPRPPTPPPRPWWERHNSPAWVTDEDETTGDIRGVRWDTNILMCEVGDYDVEGEDGSVEHFPGVEMDVSFYIVHAIPFLSVVTCSRAMKVSYFMYTHVPQASRLETLSFRHLGSLRDRYLSPSPRAPLCHPPLPHTATCCCSANAAASAWGACLRTLPVLAAPEKLRAEIHRARTRRAFWGDSAPPREWGRPAEWVPFATAAFVDASVATGCRHFGHALTAVDLRGCAATAAGALASVCAGPLGPKLRALDLGRTPVDDARALAACAALESLDLGRTRVPDAGPLAACAQLTALDLSHTPVPDVAGLRPLVLLQRLSLAHSRCADIGGLRGCVALEELDLAKVCATEARWDAGETLAE